MLSEILKIKIFNRLIELDADYLVLRCFDEMLTESVKDIDIYCHHSLVTEFIGIISAESNVVFKISSELIRTVILISDLEGRGLFDLDLHHVIMLPGKRMVSGRGPNKYSLNTNLITKKIFSIDNKMSIFVPNDFFYLVLLIIHYNKKPKEKYLVTINEINANRVDNSELPLSLDLNDNAKIFKRISVVSLIPLSKCLLGFIKLKICMGCKNV